MSNNYYVYELQYSNGTPFYVGKGKNGRCHAHIKMYDDRNSFKKNIINKIRSSGQEPIIKKVAENLTESEAFEFEKSLIAQYGRRDNNTGILTNLTDGGEGASGKLVSIKTREKLSNANTGKNHTKETKEKFKELGKTRSHFFCMREKMKDCGKNRKINQYTLDNIFIKTFKSSYEVERETGIQHSSIRLACNGKLKTSGGFIWRYA